MTDHNLGGVDIHPKLKNMHRGIKLGMALAIIILILTFIGTPVLVYFAQPDKKLAFILFAVMGVTCVPVVIMLFRLRRTSLNQIEKASWLTRSVIPYDMIMKNLGISDFSGALVELRTPDSPDGGAWGVAAVKMNKKKRLPKGDQAVKMYYDPTLPDYYLVIEKDGLLLWGNATTAEGRASNWRKFKLLFILMQGALLLSVLLLVLFSFKISGAVREEMALAKDSLSWPKAPAEVIDSKLKNVRISRGKSSITGYEAVIRYQYSVRGRTYTGDRIYFGYKPSEDRRAAQKLVEAHPVDGKMEIYYDPLQHGRSTMEAGRAEVLQKRLDKTRQTMWLAVAAGLVSTLLIVFFIWYLARKRRKLLPA